jgi:hypothetical protein
MKFKDIEDINDPIINNKLINLTHNCSFLFLIKELKNGMNKPYAQVTLFLDCSLMQDTMLPDSYTINSKENIVFSHCIKNMSLSQLEQEKQ